MTRELTTRAVLVLSALALRTLGCQSARETGAGTESDLTQDASAGDSTTGADSPGPDARAGAMTADAGPSGGSPCTGTPLPGYVSGAVIQRLLDDAHAKRGAKDAAGRYIAKPSCGTYLLTEPLIIYGDSHLDVTGIRLLARFAASTKPTMLLNAVSANAGGYSAPGNIAITGGSWDPTWDFYHRGVGESAPPMNVITFIHTRDVFIDGVTIYNVKWYHGIEFNAVDGGVVQNSFLAGWIRAPSAGPWHGEAIQLDIPADVNTWAGQRDHTECRNIHLQYNRCSKSGSQAGWGQLTGSHTLDAEHAPAHVWIENNTVTDLIWDGIATANAEDVHIRNNTIERCEGGIYVKSYPGRPLTTIEITGNKIVDTRARSAIGIRATTDTPAAPIRDAVVTGNTVTPCSIAYDGDVTFRAGSAADRCN
jgi:hypothetical protein